MSKLLDTLSPMPNWVVWAWEQDDKGNWRKPPYNARELIKASVKDPDNLSDLATALDVLNRQPLQHRSKHPVTFAGIRFAPVNTNYKRVDIDSYKTQDPARLAFFNEIHSRLGNRTYGETTPQHGYHYVGEAQLDIEDSPKKRQDYVELIGAGRYFTVDKDSANDRNNALLIANFQQDFEWIQEQLNKQSNGHVKNGKPSTGGGVGVGSNGWNLGQPQMSVTTVAQPLSVSQTMAIVSPDGEAIRRILFSPDGPKFALLMDGNYALINSSWSDSECDLALLNILRWHVDPQQAERIFHRSRTGQRSKAHDPDYLHGGRGEGIITLAYRDRPATRPLGDVTFPAIEAQVRNHVQSEAAKNVRVVTPQPSAIVTAPAHTLNTLPSVLADDAPVEWIIPGIILAGGITLITGDSKSGKSTLLTLMCYCVANGLSFLGLPAQPPRPALYFDFENPKRIIQKRFRRLQITDGPNFKYWGIHLGEVPHPCAPHVLPEIEKMFPVLSLRWTHSSLIIKAKRTIQVKCANGTSSLIR